MGKTIKAPDHICWEHHDNRGVREGKWKLVANHGQMWELYNIESDATEINNLGEIYKDKVSHLDSLYEQWAQKVGVYEYPNRDSIYSKLFQ